MALTFAVFFTAGVIANLEWDVLQSDILRTNPNRNAAFTALMMPVVGSIVALTILIFDDGLAVVIAASTIAFVERRCRSSPLWIYMLLAPVCLLAIYAEFRAPPHIIDRAVLEENAELSVFDLAFTEWLRFCGALAATWLWRTLWVQRRRLR